MTHQPVSCDCLEPENNSDHGYGEGNRVVHARDSGKYDQRSR